MPLTFDDDECYRLLLCANSYAAEYEPATYGELDHLKKVEAVRDRLREWYDARRAEHGHRPVFTKIP